MLRRGTPIPPAGSLSLIQMTDDLNYNHHDEYRNEQDCQQYGTSQRSISSLAKAIPSDGALDVDSGFGLSRPWNRWPGWRIRW